MLKNEYHIIVPVLDGHAGSDKHFSKIESNARDDPVQKTGRKIILMLFAQL